MTPEEMDERERMHRRRLDEGERVCTCDGGQENVCHRHGTEPHYAGCPRWGMPLRNLGRPY